VGAVGVVALGVGRVVQTKDLGPAGTQLEGLRQVGDGLPELSALAGEFAAFEGGLGGVGGEPDGLVELLERGPGVAEGELGLILGVDVDPERPLGWSWGIMVVERPGTATVSADGPRRSAAVQGPFFGPGPGLILAVLSSSTGEKGTTRPADRGRRSSGPR
jgi:hypothetical protein